MHKLILVSAIVLSMATYAYAGREQALMASC
jgi:hypothetical protein